MELETERLRLREFVVEDWQAVLRYQSDPLYLRFYAWSERSEEEVHRFVQAFLDQQVEQPRRKYQLAIELKGRPGLVGNCGLRVDDALQREANIGYELDSRLWGRGYASEAARAMLRFGFEKLGMHRIWAECAAENAASARVLEKVGMRLEGRLREKAFFKGAWHDHLLYAILEGEWVALEPGGAGFEAEGI